jgi:hypothetical protein
MSHNNHPFKCVLESHCNEECKIITNQCIEVDTPVKIEVATKAKGIKIECGEPIICNYSELDCHRKSSCEFVVKQFIDVRIPISYHVRTDVAESYVKCENMHKC